jgi:FkbM family methyltransferase
MSQLGADKWVLSVVPEPSFYVDVGCQDGTFLNNTLLLEKNGWKGICVDAFPKNFEDRNTTVVKAVVYSCDDKEVEFSYSVQEPWCSGITTELGMHKDNLFKYTTIQKHVFKTRTLESILVEHNAPSEIGYMNLDIEGAEYEVLRVFPFDKYTFKCISIEHNFEVEKRNNIFKLLTSKGYELVKTVHVDDWYCLKSTLT